MMLFGKKKVADSPFVTHRKWRFWFRDGSTKDVETGFPETGRKLAELMLAGNTFGGDGPDGSVLVNMKDVVFVRSIDGD